MGKKHTRSRARSNASVIEIFIDLGMLSWDESEINTFYNVDIELLCSSCKFPSCTIFMLPESLLRPNYFSLTWLCFMSSPYCWFINHFFIYWSYSFFEVIGLGFMCSPLLLLCFGFTIWMSLKVQIMGFPRIQVSTPFRLLAILVLFIRLKLQFHILF